MEFMQTVSMAEARHRYFPHLPVPKLPVERVALGQAAGRVLAAAVHAPLDVPAFSKATVDGYALQAADTAEASDETPQTLELVGRVRMGVAPEGGASKVIPGTAVRIATGGAVPPGADAVIMQEYSDGGRERVAVRAQVEPGDGILPRASDVEAGEELVPVGQCLTPAAVGVLAGSGCVDVAVFSRPQVGIISTGSELVAPEVEPAPGQVRDMNAPALAAYVAADGGQTVPLGIVTDEYDTLRAAVQNAVQRCDMVLISGGASVGERDWVADVVADLGQPGVLVHGIALKPGKPTLLAVVEETPVLGLPGNPVSALVVYLHFGRPTLHHAAGRQQPPAPGARVRARLAQSVRSPGEREEYLRVCLQAVGDGWLAEPLPAASGVLTSMLRAHGLLRIPAGTDTLHAGQLVEVTPLT